MTSIIIIFLLVLNLGVLLHINHKVPKRDYVQEAMERDGDPQEKG